MHRTGWQTQRDGTTRLAVARLLPSSVRTGTKKSAAVPLLNTTTICPAAFAVNQTQLGVRLGQLPVGIAYDPHASAARDAELIATAAVSRPDRNYIGGAGGMHHDGQQEGHHIWAFLLWRFNLEGQFGRGVCPGRRERRLEWVRR
jgi:hypothetical protein